MSRFPKIAKFKATNYNEDNILGWSEEDFNEVIYDYCNVRIQNGLDLHPLYPCEYLQICGKVQQSRMGITPETIRQDRIEALKREIERLENESNTRNGSKNSK